MTLDAEHDKEKQNIEENAVYTQIGEQKYNYYGKYVWDITVYFGCTILCVGQGQSLLIFDVEQTRLLHREYFGSDITALTFKTPSP